MYLTQRIARKILTIVLAYSFFTTTLSIFIILFNQYTTEIEEIHRNSDNIIDSQLPSITQLMWLMDNDLLQTQLKALTSNETISYVAVYDEDYKILLESGDKQRNYSDIIKKPLMHEVGKGNKPNQIGELHARISLAPAQDRIKTNLINIISTQFIKSILLSMLFLLVIHHTLTRHLQKILDYVQTHLISRSSREVLVLDRSITEDELQTLVDTLNTSKIQLDHNYDELRRQHYELTRENELRRRAEQETRTYSGQLTSTLNALTDAVFACSQQGDVLLMNEPAHALLKLSPSQLAGSHWGLADLLYLSQTDDTNSKPIDLLTLMHDRGSYQANAFCMTSEYPEKAAIPVQIKLISDILFKSEQGGNDNGFLVVIRDETDSTKLKEMAYNASHDFLTGLLNRFSFTKKLVSVLRQPDSIYALTIIDLDKFKLVNDTCGHQAGDQLLQAVAEVMKKNLSESDTLARLGGDEFIILFKDTLDNSVKKGQCIIHDIENLDFTWKNQAIFVSCSIGITPLYPDDTDESVQARADKACYQVKHDGGGAIQINERAEGSPIQSKQFKHLNEILTSLRKEDIHLYAQPLVPLHTALPPRLEILSRLHDDDEQLIYPEEFLPPLEYYYYTSRLDLSVIKKLSAYRDDLHQRGWDIHINLSPLSLSKPSHTEEILQFLRRHRNQGRRICFELSGETILKYRTHVLAFMHKARNLGASFALDDFGVGYVPFGLLGEFSFEMIKVDGKLIQEMDTSNSALELVRSIHSAAKALRSMTVAKHATSDQSINMLKSIGFDYVQGNYTGATAALQQFIK